MLVQFMMTLLLQQRVWLQLQLRLRLLRHLLLPQTLTLLLSLLLHDMTVPNHLCTQLGMLCWRIRLQQ